MWELLTYLAIALACLVCAVVIASAFGECDEAASEFHGVVGELRDPFAELRLLAAKCQEEQGGQETRLAVDQFDNTIVIFYHRTVALHWRVADRELTCFPTGWRQRTYRTSSAVVHDSSRYVSCLNLCGGFGTASDHGEYCLRQ
jgi:hypothetical protein